MGKQVRKPVVSEEEIQYRDELYPDIKKIKNKNILCTSCNGSLKVLILKGKPKTHPFMDTLLCEKCNDFFGDGEFSVDEDGSDKYCRWCGQGGTLYLCSTCTAGFCKKCIKRNLPRAALKEVENDDWQCFCCNVKPLYELRAHCWAANKFAIEVVKNEEGRKRKFRKSDKSQEESASDESESNDPKKIKCDDSSDEEETPPLRKSNRQQKKLNSDPSYKETKKQKYPPNQRKKYKPVVVKLSATIKDALSMTQLFRKKANACLNKKISLNYMDSVENVVEVCNKVDTLLQSVESISHQLRTSVKDYLQSWKQSIGEIEPTESIGEIEPTDKKEDNREMEVNGIDDEKMNLEDKSLDPAESKTSEKDEQSEEDESIKKLTDHEETNDIQKSDFKSNDSKSFEDAEETIAEDGDKIEVQARTQSEGIDKIIDRQVDNKDKKTGKEDDKSDTFIKKDEMINDEEGDKTTDTLIMDCDIEKTENGKKQNTDDDITKKDLPSNKLMKNDLEDE